MILFFRVVFAWTEPPLFLNLIFILTEALWVSYSVKDVFLFHVIPVPPMYPISLLSLFNPSLQLNWMDQFSNCVAFNGTTSPGSDFEITLYLHTGNLLDPVDNDKSIRQPHLHWVICWTYLCDQDRNLKKNTDFYMLDLNFPEGKT